MSAAFFTAVIVISPGASINTATSGKIFSESNYKYYLIIKKGEGNDGWI